MASNDEYQQQNEWRYLYPTMQESWMEKMIEHERHKITEKSEKLMFTAQKGSLLDTIWNKTNNNKNKQ